MLLVVKLLHPKAKPPERKHPWDAGFDLYSIENVTVKPGELKVVRTGIAVAIPPSAVGIIKDRSSMASKGLHILAGVIDAGYRGEVKVVVVNLGKEPIEIKEGQRFAQLLVLQKEDIWEVKVVDELPPSDGRGEGGFGSTGVA